MRTLALAAALVALATPLAAQEPAPLSPSQIVEAAPAADWVAIAPRDLVVMDLAPDRDGKPRRVVIQLMPEPFSQGWVDNIRTLIAARWYDGISVNRVQDNYVVQWGDANHDNPAAEGEAKPLPDGLKVMEESAYYGLRVNARRVPREPVAKVDPYSQFYEYQAGMPFAGDASGSWPVHCYGMVGVGRGLSPDTGSGAELYTVIGHAPRHLDRNIALVGRVIEGIEHLSSLPRGTGPLGFYETAEERVPISSVRLGDEVAGLPAFEYLSTESETFARYAEARANRRDEFFIRPAGGADICNIPVPVRRKAGS